MIELLIVIGIITIIVAMAVPNLIRSRITANESAVIAALKALVTTEESFRAQQDDAYTTIKALATATPPYIDSALATGTRHGYTFAVTAFRSTWHCRANPVIVGTDGNRRFYVDESGVIRANSDTTAGSDDNPIK